MKIIARAIGDSFLIESTDTELGRITGIKWADKNDFSIGQEINVNNLFDQYHAMINNKSDVKKIKQSCKEILESITKIDLVAKTRPEPKD